MLQAAKDAQDILEEDIAQADLAAQNDNTNPENNAQNNQSTAESDTANLVSHDNQIQVDDKMESLEPSNLSDINMEGIINLDDLGSGHEELDTSNGKDDNILMDASSNNNTDNDFLNFEDPSQLDNVDLFGEDPLDQGQTQQDADQQLNMTMNNNGDIDMDLLFGEMDEPQDATSNLDDALHNLNNADGIQNTSNELMFDLGSDGKLDMMNLDLPTHLPNDVSEGGDATVEAGQNNDEVEAKPQTQLPVDTGSWALENDQTFNELMQSFGDEDLNSGSNFDDLFGDIYNN